ncbi:MAG TPA: ATP-binding cassette domain-containing protein, partial [Candidatus Angelobacter sp.]|nr:ATP-binding cassette domain-containing protein [Candidatus Angelobacter sp.]
MISHSSTDALAQTGKANEALTPAHEPVLRVSNLGITMEGRSIVANVSFSLSRESSLAIIGPNGSGKTQLLKS